MDTRRLLSLMLTLTAAFLIPSPAIAERQLSSAGVKFVVAYTGYRPDLQMRSRDKQVIVVNTQKDHNIGFTVSNGIISVPYTVNSTYERTIELHSPPFGGEDQKGIMISSSDGVSKLTVMGYITYTDGLVSDTYTILPLHNYSSYTYFAASHSYHEGDKGFVQIAGTEADTMVTVTPVVDVEECPGSRACAAGETCMYTLQSLEVLRLCSRYNLTGTKIVSTRPLAVFSGHDCVQVGSGNCEFLIEQIPPFVTWGKTFLVGPLQGRNTGEMYNIISAEENTKASVYCTSQHNSSNWNFELTREGSAHTFSVGSTRMCSIRADKPVMVMLLAPNDPTDGAFMSLIPPVEQLTDTATIFGNISITITLPESSCPKAQCSILIDNEGTSIDIATESEPIYCSPSKVCGYSVVASLPEGMHRLRLSGPGGMAVIAYNFTSNSGFGTVAGLSLNYIAVSSPRVTIIPDGDLQLMSGESLVLTCNVSIMDIVDDCVEVSARWLRVESGEEIRSAPPIEVHHDTTFKIEHAFESLSKENSGTYKCEANVTSKQAGLLATATESVNLNVTDPVIYRYIQLLIVGVTKCSEWVLSDTKEKVAEITEMVVGFIQERCSCDFSSRYISEAIFKCPAADPDKSNKVLFRARVQEGGSSPVSYGDIVTYLEAAQSKPFTLKGFRLTITSEKECSVMINSLDDPTATCFMPPNVPTEGVDSGAEEEGDNTVIIVAVVASCVVVFLLGLASLIVGGVVISRRNTNVINQRPKSIHLHTRSMMPGGDSRTRLMPSGDSVTSFSPHSGSTNSNIYIEKECSPTTVTAYTLPVNGVATPSSPISQDGLTTHTSFPLPQNGVSHHEAEENYKTMKTDLSKFELPISHV